VEDFPNLCPSIELLVREENTNKIGDNKAELVKIVSALGLPGVGICWDLGHDARNGSKAVPPGLVPLVRHLHVHDISPDGEDHCPLIFGNVPYEKHLRRLVGAGYRGIIVLEVNGYRVSHLAAAERVHPFQILCDSFRELAELTSVC